ncbi:DUF1405 domain-containing protein [Cohnella faecalis]|uniref:DUF1405 domain-containing protein n=1 Tax=Cohnella faecalis TaxID=2315694 RepID=A0A398CRT4_9BACL|nr:DUF1405 domain-containing protein [Cohnella faecalis]
MKEPTEVSLRWYFSKHCLLHPVTLLLLLLIYVPGTIYGYIWYEDQLVKTWNHHPHWQIPFVPDSPTASLFFAIAVLWLWISPKPSKSGFVQSIRGIIEALGVVTSVKYGIWATVIIFWGQAQGDVLYWEHWMLIIGHTAMAVTALLYARFFFFNWISLAVAAAWTFLNDSIDYGYGIFPYLPSELDDDLVLVRNFTFILTGLSVLSGAWARFVLRRKSDNPF